MGDAGSSKRPRLDGSSQDLSRTYERALAEASMQLRGQSSLRLPWEKGIYAEIFSGSELPKMPSLPVPAALPAGDVTRPEAGPAPTEKLSIGDGCVFWDIT